ncbi:hypothetical protein ACFQJC_05790 [Haloferax namakaokahaiae]|uniref:DUF7344 domain-containing protein n=1 Tax=Haloferax namakaokahaiae TaxID=1748331 RepID=A0ABD5ZCR9_9EURY
MSTKGSSERLPVALDELFDLLGQQRRRDLIAELSDRSSPVTLFSLAANLSESNDGIIDEEVMVTLHHIDLPELDSAGLLTYDPSQQLVTFDSTIEDVSDALEDVEDAIGSVRDSL